MLGPLSTRGRPGLPGPHVHSPLSPVPCEGYCAPFRGAGLSAHTISHASSQAWLLQAREVGAEEERDTFPKTDEPAPLRAGIRPRGQFWSPCSTAFPRGSDMPEWDLPQGVPGFWPFRPHLPRAEEVRMRPSLALFSSLKKTMCLLSYAKVTTADGLSVLTLKAGQRG